MTLRLKINLIVGVLMGMFVATLLGQQVGDMRASVAEETEAAHRVAGQLLDRMVYAYAAQGRDVLLAYLRDMGRVRSNDLTLLDRAGHVLYQSPPSPYKAGRSAPGWFEAMVSPPPSIQAITFPDGRLEIRSNASRSALDAWDQFVSLLAWGAGLLLIGLATVFWLVGRAVRPFGRIVEALNALEAGQFDRFLPRLPGREASAIGDAFNRMVRVLRQNLETERRAAAAERQLSDHRRLTHFIDGQLEQERRHIARELHDELGQSVTAMRSMALSIASRVGATDPESERAARLIADESSRLYDAMHGLIPRLTPLVLDQLGLEEALRDLVERTRASQPSLRLDFETSPAASPSSPATTPSPEAALTLFRAAQEGLTNALRHGHAAHVEMRLQSADGHATLEVLDDGDGLAPDWGERRGHYGLQWLEERVEAVGGRFEIGARPERGVRLSVRVPVTAAEAKETV
jgi:two-component system sensor histidine kinase UhpB